MRLICALLSFSIAVNAGAVTRRGTVSGAEARRGASMVRAADVERDGDTDARADFSTSDAALPVLTLTVGDERPVSADTARQATAATAPLPPLDAAPSERERRANAVYQHAIPSAVMLEIHSTKNGPRIGHGSGFMWDGEHVVTNFHVMEAGAGKFFTATFEDGTELQAVPVGGYARGDIAVMRLVGEPKGLRPVVRGDSDALFVGQDAFALGSPMGMKNSFTQGNISALHREIMGATGPMRGLIQTTAVIMKGSSGGMLLDCAARLMGITTIQISGGCGSSAGIGLAVPVSLVEQIVPKILRGEKVAHPSLGIHYVDDKSKAHLGLDDVPEGVIVADVPRGSLAESSGMRALRQMRGGMMIFGDSMAEPFVHTQFGDVITAINGRPVKTLKQLYEIVDALKIGDDAVIETIQDGKPRTYTLKLGADTDLKKHPRS